MFGHKPKANPNSAENDRQRNDIIQWYRAELRRMQQDAETHVNCPDSRCVRVYHPQLRADIAAAQEVIASLRAR